MVDMRGEGRRGRGRGGRAQRRVANADLEWQGGAEGPGEREARREPGGSKRNERVVWGWEWRRGSDDEG